MMGASARVAQHGFLRIKAPLPSCLQGLMAALFLEPRLSVSAPAGGRGSPCAALCACGSSVPPGLRCSSLHSAAMFFVSTPPSPFFIKLLPLEGRDAGISSEPQHLTQRPARWINSLKTLVLYFKKSERIPGAVSQRPWTAC